MVDFDNQFRIFSKRWAEVPRLVLVNKFRIIEQYWKKRVWETFLTSENLGTEMARKCKTFRFFPRIKPFVLQNYWLHLFRQAINPERRLPMINFHNQIHFSWQPPALKFPTRYQSTVSYLQNIFHQTFYYQLLHRKRYESNKPKGAQKLYFFLLSNKNNAKTTSLFFSINVLIDFFSICYSTAYNCVGFLDRKTCFAEIVNWCRFV